MDIRTYACVHTNIHTCTDTHTHNERMITVYTVLEYNKRVNVSVDVIGYGLEYEQMLQEKM